MPLFYLCGAFLSGVLLAERLPWSAAAWLAGALGVFVPAAIVLLILRQRPLCTSPPLLGLLAGQQLHPAAVPAGTLRALPFLILCAFCTGAARYTAWQPLLDEPGFIARYTEDGVRYTVVGILVEPPDERDRVTYPRVDALELRPADGFRHLPVGGMLLARIDPGGERRYGDRVAVTGSLQIPPEDEDFSYRDYLARQGIYAYMPFAEAALLDSGHGSPLLAAVFAFKDRAWQTLQRLFPDPEVSLLSGILLGLDSGLSPDLQEDFRATGTSPIIAISGFNIAILAAIFTSAFGRLQGRRLGTASAIAAVILYTVLVGADAAVVRAAVMGVMAVALRQAGRATTGLNALVLAAAVMAFANPSILADPGFQLSFAATLGLVLYADPLAEGFSRLASRYLRISAVRRIRPFVTDAFLLTLAAQITTLPVVVYHFGRLSLTALLVNPLVQPAVMVLGGVAALAGLGWMPLGRAAALLAYPFTAYTIRLVVLVAAVSLLPLVARALNRIGPAGARVFPAWRIAVLAALLGLSAAVWKTNLASAGGVFAGDAAGRRDGGGGPDPNPGGPLDPGQWRCFSGPALGPARPPDPGRPARAGLAGGGRDGGCAAGGAAAGPGAVPAAVGALVGIAK